MVRHFAGLQLTTNHMNVQGGEGGKEVCWREMEV